jgi:hypothetical protein
MKHANEQRAVGHYHSGGKPAVITASEVGEFVFCAKAWQLKRAGAVADDTHLNAGQIFHARHGAHLALSWRLRRAGLVLAGMACLLLLILLALWSAARAS